MVGLVYSAITGGYDTPLWPVEEEGVDYIMFSDKPIKGLKVWQQAFTPKESDPRTAARKVKVLTPTLKAYQKYDWFLWVDGNVQIVNPIRDNVEQWIGEHWGKEIDFAAFPHPWWQCSYTEVDKCIALKKDSVANLEKGRKLLKESKFPVEYGQIDTAVLLRKRSQAVIDHASGWWAAMESTTMRDQVTFMLNLWLLEQSIGWMPGNRLSNYWFKRHEGHKK